MPSTTSTPSINATLALLALSATLAGCRHTSAQQPNLQSNLQLSAQSRPAVTDITLDYTTLHTGVRRLGINLGGQSFYDSGQMLRNLVFRNPGFEAGAWQSILHCKAATATTCTDSNQYTVWPAGFLNGAQYQIVSGNNAGVTGTVRESTAASTGNGVTLTLQGKAPAAGDYIRVRLDKPGHADAGWWVDAHNGAQVSAELHDLSPSTLGKQALRVDAAAQGQSLNLSSYFDSLAGHSFVQLRGTYTLSFRARGISSPAAVGIDLTRLDTAAGRKNFFSKSQPLTNQWHDYTYTFQAQEPVSAQGTIGLTFQFNQAAALIDDVTLTETASPGNPTQFRDSVVQALRTLHPGVLRYMDSGGNFGSSIDNMIAPAFARQRTGASEQESLHEDIPLGLEEFLELSAAVGAEPWYSMPPGASPEEAAALIEFLAGSSDTPYGRRRAALGHAAPWTSAFPVIHLELGNEEWNNSSFAGSSIDDPVAYGQRTTAVFGAMRHAPAFKASQFDLIMGAWSAVPWWTGKQLQSSSGVDTFAIAPYLFNNFNDTSSTESIFGPMFAQPQALDGSGGQVAQQTAVTKGHGLAVYEVNLGTGAGSATQAKIDSTVPSLGAGIAVIEHMLLMLRDDDVTTQCLFGLPQYRNNFTGAGSRTMPLWGAVVDMGGATNLRRPQYLAEQLANLAILPTELRTTHAAQEPTWNQAKSDNDQIELRGAKDLLSFAFTDGQHHSLILINLDRTNIRSVNLTGPAAPTGKVTESRLNAANLTSSNEKQEQVAITTNDLTLAPNKPYQLPAHSMTVLTW